MQIPTISKIVDNLTNKRKNICIVMPTYNQYNETKKNIDILKKQTLVPDIIIVDNNSSDGTFDRFSQEYDDIILIKTAGNYGGAGGFYLGQKYAYENGYEWIILNDNDAFPIDNNIIEKILEKSSISNFVFLKNNISEGKKMGVIFHYGFFHREIIKKIGFVDYKLFLYGDDEDYLLKLKKNNINFISSDIKYSHPFKLYISPIGAYFYVRNLLILSKNSILYKFKQRLYLSFHILFWNIYQKDTTFNVAQKAINDYKNNIFIDFPELQDYISKLKKDNVEKFNLSELINYKDKINFFKGDEKLINYGFKKSNIFFVQNLLTYSYIKSFFGKKIYFLVDFDKNNSSGLIFTSNKSYFYKIIYLLYIYFYLLYI